MTGLDEVKRSMQDADNRRVELCSALGIDTDTGWSDAMSEIDKRLMPPGMEWPRFEDGEQVKIGDMVELNAMVAKVCGVFISKHGYVLHGESGEKTGSDTRFDYPNFGSVKRPKQDPIGADGLHIHDDETVYLVDGNGEPLYVIDIETEGYQTVRVRKSTGYVINYDPQRLTHTKPEPPNSWERIAEDLKKDSCEYFGYQGKPCYGCPAFDVPACELSVRADIVRRAKALAEKENGNE